MLNPEPNKEKILEVFDYKDGALFRKTTGMRGYLRPDGYVYMRLHGRCYGEHRVIHFLFTGEWPYQVDHKNGVRNDNRFENLRSATHSQNCMNRQSTTGRKGCSWNKIKGKWAAQIGQSGKRKTIGYFDDLSAAIIARNREASKLHGDFARS